jgi:hypothetical protein
MDQQINSTCPNIESFIPNNMVVTVRWDGTINLNDASKTLPILTLDEKPTMKGGHVKIPYYGIENVIVSVRYKKSYRGMRKTSKNSDNFVSTDLQIDGKNVHIKLSTTNAVVMGVTEYQKAIDAIHCLFDIMKMSDDNLEYLRKSKAKNVDSVLSFISSMAIENKPSIGLPGYKEVVEKLAAENERLKSLSEKEIDFRLCMILLSYAYESETTESFTKNIGEITVCSPIEPENVKILMDKCRVSNSAYNYKLIFPHVKDQVKLPGVFVLRNLANAIIQINDPNIVPSHHNWSYKYVYVAMSVDSPEPGNPDKQVIHRFNISEGGSIRQWSPSFTEKAFEIQKMLIHIIRLSIASDPNVYISPE